MQGNHGLFYRDALRFLGCVDVAALGPDETAGHAYDLALAALLGKNVYNFGELVRGAACTWS